MIVRDTLAITDSLTCRFIIIDRPVDLPITEILKPVDSLWGAQTLSKTVSSTYLNPNKENNIQNYIGSGFVLLFLVFVFLFFREILATIPNIIKNVFNFRAQKALEDKLSSVNQRNIVSLIGALFLTFSIALAFGNFFQESSGLESYILIPIAFGVITAYWIFKTLLLRFSGWVLKTKQPFWLIGKIGYNHLILAAIFTIPAIITPIFIIGFDELLLAKFLAICYLAIFTLYLVRVYQIIISYHFSLFFYILYLCTVEILPIALFINFTLSYQ